MLGSFVAVKLRAGLVPVILGRNGTPFTPSVVARSLSFNPQPEGMFRDIAAAHPPATQLVLATLIGSPGATGG
jgi:hypothetical protein